MQRIITWIEAQTRWRALVLCAVAGASLTLSFAPFYVFPMVVVALSVLFLQLRAAPTRKAGFVRAWAWGYGFFVSSTYWISLSLLVDAEQFAWLIPFALLGLPAALALFYGAFGAAFVALRPARVSLQLLAFVLLFTVSEYARGHLFTGFPWNLIGYSSGAIPALEQQAYYLGVYGLGLCISTWALAWLLCNTLWQRGLWLCVPIAFMVFGAFRTLPEYRASGVVARVVQASVPQKLKWNPAHRQEIIQRYVNLSKQIGMDRVDVFIWPESALPFVLYEDGGVPEQLYGFLQEGQQLVTGGTRAERHDDGVRFWNSIFVIDHSGAIVSHYDKHHLVPFGEYVPFSEYLPMERIAPGFGAFSRGQRGAQIKLAGFRSVLPLICYESIFPHYAVSGGEVQLLLNLTNDAWFGRSIGPYQHEAIARMRSIEQGVSLLRVANTGVSGYYFPDGRIVHRTGLEETLAFDVMLMYTTLD